MRRLSGIVGRVERAPVIRRGEFYSWTEPGDRPRYVLVLSDDGANRVTWPIVAPVIRSGAGSLWLVALGETDPVSGRVALNALGPLDPARLDGPAGMVSGATLERITAGLSALFGFNP
jgi:mRNA-degrading endonuclease toxin of MazEF toxin-antitoxin module